MSSDSPEHWYGTNFTGLPTPLLGSAVFNEHPCALHIHGTLESHTGLFRLLANCATQSEAALVFQHYMKLQFELADSRQEPQVRDYRSASYVELLRGWGYDSSSPQGAVLKGWVESRFGLVPAYHKECLGRFPSPAWVSYLEEKHNSRFHSNCINLQLDVLYEYCQWSLSHFPPLPGSHICLWRGSNDCQAQLLDGHLKDGHCLMRLNNLLSFCHAPETAEIFGDWLLQARVPRVKLLFFPGLLADQVLRSEGEYLVIGGNYQVGTHHGWLRPLAP